MFGLLNINKPSGITSRRVVDRVARLVKPHKAGHAGTLDPLASGVLVVCVGQATRLIEYVQRMPKRYRATFLLGRSSPTEDIEGDVSELPGAPQPSLDQIEQAARGMLGQLAQRPPAFSAVKVDGRRSYDLARAGRAVELAPRTIEVHAIALVGYSYPQLELDIRCGSGTYVRTLGRELAERLGSCAVMSALVRTEIGTFRLAESVKLVELAKENLPLRLLSPLRAVEDLPRIALSQPEIQRIANGLAIARQSPADATEYAGVDELGKLVAILAKRGTEELATVRYFPQ